MNNEEIVKDQKVHDLFVLSLIIITAILIM